MAQGIVLLGGMVVALGVVAWIVLGDDSLPWVLVIGGFLVVTRPKVPTSWMLSMYGASPLPEGAAPEVHHYIRVLAKRAGLPRVPRLYYVSSPMVNAFAVGRGRRGLGPDRRNAPYADRPTGRWRGGPRDQPHPLW